MIELYVFGKNDFLSLYINFVKIKEFIVM